MFVLAFLDGCCSKNVQQLKCKCFSLRQHFATYCLLLFVLLLFLISQQTLSLGQEDEFEDIVDLLVVVKVFSIAFVSEKGLVPPYLLLYKKL